MTIVQTADAGKRLDVWLSESEGITRSAAQKLITDGEVTVNGKPAVKNTRLRAGDEIEAELPEPVADDAVPQDIPLDIVYEDTDLLVVNKPRGMVVHPAPGNPDGTLVNALLWHCRDSLSGINGVIRPGIVHRIDKDTAGLLIVAKTDTAHLALAEQIQIHDFEREYRAIVVGALREDRETVDAPIGRHPKDRKKMAVVAGGRPARTHYEVLGRYTAMGSSFTYVKLILETGRTHQIRVHMASLGHPVLGDEVYGGNHTAFEKRCADQISGQCLYAKLIGFRHPADGRFLRLEGELPDYFQTILHRLEENTK